MMNACTCCLSMSTGSIGKGQELQQPMIIFLRTGMLGIVLLGKAQEVQLR